MIPLTALWLSILLSAVIVFVARKPRSMRSAMRNLVST